MKKNDVQIGATYLVKVTNNLVPVKITREHDNGGWEGQSLKTLKTIRIKSAQRLRKPLADASWATTTPDEHRQRHASEAKQKRIMTKDEYEAEAAAEATQDATPATERDTDERDATVAKREGRQMSLLDAAAQVLVQVDGGDMRCKDIVEVAIARGLWTPGDGKTPANSLYAAILREITTKGDASRFVKSERGKFALTKSA